MFLPTLLPLPCLAVVLARTRWHAAVASVALLSLSGRALAGPSPGVWGQPRELSPEVARPPWRFECACGTEAEFVGRLWDEHGVDPAAARLVALRILPRGGSFELTIQSEGDAPRALADGSCRTLFDTALVIVAAAASLETPTPGAESSATQGPAEPEARASSPSGSDAEPPPGQDTQPSRSGLSETKMPQNDLPASESSSAKAAAGAPEQPEPSAGDPKANASQGHRSRPDRGMERADPTTVSRSASAAPKNRWRLRPLASVAAGGSAGLHPNLAAFVELELGLTLQDWGLATSARYAPATTDRTFEDMGLTMSSLQLRLAALYFVRSWLRVAVGPTVARLDGTGRGIARPEAASIWLFASELEVSVAPVRSGAFSLETGLRGSVALNSPRFELDGGIDIYRVPRAGAALFLRGTFRPR